MNILIVGSGGREHALAWKLAESKRVERIYVAPGNGGTQARGRTEMGAPVENVGRETVPLLPPFDDLIAFARRMSIGLTVIGPEAPLAEGIVDAFQAAGLRCFGPSQAAAQLEASKSFAKAFMLRHGLPTARYYAFREYGEALAYLQGVDHPVVIKASGLAAGKGVIIPAGREEAVAALGQIMLDRAFGSAGDEVLIEERLAGPEASVLAFCDGQRIALMPAAQDHKRAGDGDQGPNTGGMGAFAPAPLMTPQLLAQVVHSILEPAVAGIRSEGHPYVGVLYAGIMLTERGPRVLEFNCRFGDPEAQVILPLLESDLLDVLEACLDGTLATVGVRWRAGAAATVVAASRGYPGAYARGCSIQGLDGAAGLPGVTVFHSGTRRCEDGSIETDGGRVLAVTGLGDSLSQAAERAYAGMNEVHFEGMHFRHDIGRSPVTYRDAGVDIAAGTRAVELMRDAVQATYGPEVLLGIGAFGGLYDGAALKRLRRPILVASTDGVGTKTKIAAAMGHFDTIGHDIVNHCVNDILVQGARPLFFLDYIASSRLNAEQVAAVVSGCAAACRAAGCALLGGETAEMPGVYVPGEFDLAGTIVGVVERSKVVDGRAIRPGDAILGLASSGLHTNGFSLARRVLEGRDLAAVVPELGCSLGMALLEPHRSYLAEIHRLQENGITIRGMAHITGGGLIDNPPRILPRGTAARLERGRWPIPPIFELIQQAGQIGEPEMAHVFNLGLGMLVVVPRTQADRALGILGSRAWCVGEVVAHTGEPRVFI